MATKRQRPKNPAISQPSELPETVAVTPIATNRADTTNVNHRIGSETLTFSMSRIVDVEARKSNGVYEFGWKQVMVIDIDRPGRNEPHV